MGDLVGRKATIVGYSKTGEATEIRTDTFTHISFDIEGHLRLIVEAAPGEEWRVTAESRPIGAAPAEETEATS